MSSIEVRTDDMFKYDALQEPNKTIRLVKIVSTTPQISCQLKAVSLENPPDFIALSYVWGDASVTSLILLNGKSHSVTTNLVNAMRGVYHHCAEGGEGPWLWADAVCIDQANTTEKSHQVPLMGRIYSDAQRVFCWLGDTKEVSEAVEAINRVAGELAKQPSCEGITQQLGTYPHGPEVPEDELAEPESVNLESVRGALKCVCPNEPCSEEAEKVLKASTIGQVITLFALPYWHRLWIFQEVVLARDMMLVCGTTKASWKAVCTVLFWLRAIQVQIPLHDRPQHVHTLEWLSLHSMFKILAWYKIVTAKRLVKIRRWSQECNATVGLFSDVVDILAIQYQATNPKDYVYGLGGVTGSCMGVDYSDSKTVAQTYQDYVAYILLINRAQSETAPNSILTRSGTKYSVAWFFQVAGVGYYWDTFPGLPSWAPNFAGVAREYHHQSRSTTIIAHDSYKSDCDIFEQHRSSLKLVDSVLSCAAVIVGPVVTLGPVVHQGERLIYNNSPEADLWMLWMFDCAVSSADRYSSGREILYDMFKALIHVVNPLDKPIQCEFELFIVELKLVCERRRDMTHSDFYSQLRIPAPATKLVEGNSDWGERWHQQTLEVWSRCEINDLTMIEAYLNVLWTARRSNHQLRMAFTEWGAVGIFPPLLEESDLVCVVDGSHVPVCLRRCGSGYILVGICYVNGLMKGEAGDLVRKGLAKVEDINIV
jgi:hypothetical protein